MTSQISIHKLLKHELRQQSWMFGLTALLHFLTGPVLFLLSTSHSYNWTAQTATIHYHRFFNSTYIYWQLFTMIVCICIAIFVYRYLFSRRMVDLYHSVPIRRRQLYSIKYLHGFLIWFLPFVANAGCIILLSSIRLWGKPYLFPILSRFMKSFLLLLLCFFIFYHLFLTAVYISGNVLNMFANTAIIGCSVIGVWSICYAHADYYFDTFCFSPSNIIYDALFALSPFTTPFAICIYYGEGIIKQHLPLVFVSLFLSAGLLLLSRLAYLKRPSELAEQGTIYKSFTIPARMIVSVFTGIAGSIFFSEIASGHNRLPWGIFGAILCSIVSYGAINSIFRTTIKAFFQHKPQIILSALVSTFIILTFQLDLFGYDTYIPDKDKIAGVAVYTSRLSDGSANYTLDEHNNLISAERITMVTQNDLLTDPDLCYNLLNTSVHGEPEGSYASTYYVKVKLTNGRTYERRYNLYHNQLETIRPFIESDAYRNTNYKYSTGKLGYPDELTINLWFGHFSFDVNEKTMQSIMNAYWEDFHEHYNMDDLSSYMRIATLSGRYINKNTNYQTHFDLDVPENYTRTTSILKELQPDYYPVVKSLDEIKEIYLFSDIYSENYDLDDVYQYFGYEVDTPSKEPEEIDAELSEESAVIATKIAETISPEFYERAYRMELSVKDRETLELLYPLLTFGSYRDLFDQNEYILVGHLTAADNEFNINCYIKPGTMPEEIIKKLYDTKIELK